MFLGQVATGLGQVGGRSGSDGERLNCPGQRNWRRSFSAARADVQERKLEYKDKEVSQIRYIGRYGK
jgi:hypothetical protein